MAKGNLTGNGWFKPGQSGNASGRPKSDLQLSELARSFTKEAIETLVSVMQQGKKESDRIHAAMALLDRAYGRPSQSLEHSVEEKGPLVAVIVDR